MTGEIYTVLTCDLCDVFLRVLWGKNNYYNLNWLK